MSGQQYQIRGDTRANLAAVTPAAKEIFSVTDKTGEMGVGTGAKLANDNILLLKRKGHHEGLTTAQITTTQNDYNPAGLAYAETLYLNSDASRAITGIAGGDTDRFLNIVNVGSFNISLSDADPGSLAANRFALGANVVIRPKQGVGLLYLAASSRWICVSDAQMWKGVVDLPENLTLSGDLSPAQITANQNDYAPTGLVTSSVLRLNSDASRNVTGITGGADGRILKLLNVGSNAIVLKNADVNSTAANRFDMGADITLAAKNSISLWYDLTDSRWKMFANTAGAAVADAAVTAVKLAASALAQGVGMINGTLAEAHGANAVTYAVKTLAGVDPSATDPVYFIFRDPSASSGSYAVRSVTAALSVTISAGSSLGFTNATPGRVWIGALDNAGAVELFVINCVSGGDVYPLGQFPLISTTAEGGAGNADSPQVAYSTSARASKPYVVLGYASYEAGLTTAGNWAVSQSRLQLFGSGVPLPGQRIQIGVGTATGATTVSTATPVQTALSKAITLTSAANLVRARACGGLSIETNTGFVEARLSRGAGPTLFGSAATLASGNGSAVHDIPVSMQGTDVPGATALTYYVYIYGSGVLTTGAIWNRLGGQASIELEEIMG